MDSLKRSIRGKAFYFINLLLDFLICLAVTVQLLGIGDCLARTVVEIYLLVTIARFPADGELHSLAVGIWQGIVEVEGYQGIANTILGITILIVTKLYLVWILWVHTGKKVDDVWLLTAPECTEAESEITILGYCYPIANDIYLIIAILRIVLCQSREIRCWLLGENAVNPVDVYYLRILVALLIGSCIVDECSNLLAIKDWSLEVLGEQCGVVIQLQIAGICILLDCY